MPEKRTPLLPADHYLAAMLWPDDSPGVAAEKYRWFRAEIESNVKIDPGQPQAGAALGIIAFASAVISIGLTIAASFFKPKQSEPGSGGVSATERQGGNVIVADRVAPSIGFDSVQQPSALGSVIPVIWARRQTLGPQVSPPRPAGAYGGIRVNTGLIWSQLWTWHGSQILRAIFLVGEGTMGAPDPTGYAIGDNSLSTYEIRSQIARELVARATIYFNPTGGPILNTHRVLGRAANQDIANNMNYGGPTVFSIRDANEEYQQNFCYATKPSTSTVFGVYSHIPNGMGFRPAARIRPTIRVTTKSVGSEGDFEVDCDDDPQALADHWKNRYQYSLRGGIIDTEGGLNMDPGDTIRYRLEAESNGETKFVFDNTNTDNSKEESAGEASCTDIASAIASRQKAADDALIIGEVYKIGSCLAILVDRSPDDRIFVSEIDNDPIGNGNSMEYVFRVIRSGRVEQVGGDYLDPSWSDDSIKPPPWNRNSSMNTIDIPDEFETCSSFPQIFRCAIASVSLARSARIFELGIKSTVGIQINGYTNFRDCKSLVKINQDAGMKYQGQRFDKNEKIGVTNFTSGTIQRTETRVSFFLIQYREGGNNDWITIDGTWGIKGASQQPSFCLLRFEMPTSRRWEVRFEPLTSYELRNDTSLKKPFYVIHGKSGRQNRTVVNNGIIIEWYGEERDGNRKSFNLPWLDPTEDIGIPDADSNSFLDDWAMVAESFIYDQIQTTCQNGPEHEIVYVNTFSVNPIAPTYDGISTLGLTIFASTEFNQLPQLSAYFPNGHYSRRILESDASGSTNLFPDVLRAYLTNTKFGRGEVIGDALVDYESFKAAAGWCQVRRYFYDAADSVKVNLLRWAADTAAFHLLELNDRGGKWALVQALYFPEDGPVPVKALFTAGNIVEGTFRLQFLPDTERQPIRCSVKWREERQKSDLTSSGFFPVEREVFVQEVGQSDSDPIEAIDVSAFCTNVEHAIDIACFIIRMRRLITHTISFSTTPDGLGTGLAAGDYIRVAVDRSYYDQFAHGIILNDGTVLSTRSDIFTTGTHQVIAWDGASDFIYNTEVVIDEDGKASPTNIVFARKSQVSEVITYKIEKITVSEEGTIDIEAVHHPCDENGVSEIGKNWTTYQTDANWIIEGNESELDYCTCPLVSGTSLPGNTLSVGSVVCNSGTATTVGVQWYRDFSPIAGATSSSYMFTSADSGKTVYAEITYQTTQGVIGTCRSYAAASDAFADSVVLLLHMDGDHNMVSFPDYSPYSHATFEATLNPSQGGVYSGCRIVRNMSRFGGSSATYYSSSFGGPYLRPNYSHPNAFQVSVSDDFTMECWIYPVVSGGTIFSCFGFDCEFGWHGGNSDASIRVRAAFPNNAWFIDTGVFQVHTWRHIAVVRNSGVLSIYVDGVSRATGLAAFASTNTTCSVGGLTAGFQDEVRFTKGIARYTASFTPPANSFLPASTDVRTQESHILLMHCNGTNGSLTTTNDTFYYGDGFYGMKAGHTYISTAQSKFGGSSMYFSGDFANGSTLGINFLPDILTADFTIDLWIRPNTKSGFLWNKFGQCSFGGSGLQLFVPGISTIFFENVANGATITIGQWNHVAITREGVNTYTFCNGKLAYQYTHSTPYVLTDGSASTIGLGIGGYAYNTSLWSGYLDEFRVMINKADWTAEFTPPTQPYIAIPG